MDDSILVPSEEMNDSIECSFEEVQAKNCYEIKNNFTFYSSLKKGANSCKDIFIEAVLRIIGELANEKGLSFAYILTCRARNNEMVLVTKQISMTFGAFSSCAQFTKELQQGFGHGLVVDGAITRGDLSDYLRHLRQQYGTAGNFKTFKEATTYGYMGSGYWYLNQKLQILNGRILNENQRKYFASNKDNEVPLSIEGCLMKKTDCISVNKKIVESLSCLDSNQNSVEFVFAFVLSRLLSLTLDEDGENGEYGTGESNMLLLFGEKNVGKTFTQHLVHYGQGATRLSPHGLLLSGGNAITSGTTIHSTQDISKKTTMILSMNDVVNNKIQAESLVQMHERLTQGSSKAGMWQARCSGVILSSNNKELDRAEGRVIRLTFEKCSFNEDKNSKLKDLKKLCQDYKGFLMAWVLHFGTPWRENASQAQNLISSIIANYTSQQQRWCSGVALAIYTKFLYFQSLELNTSIKEELELVIKTYDTKDRYNELLFELENSIRSKMLICSQKSLTWLRRDVTVNSTIIKPSNKSAKKKNMIPALTIKATVVSNEFTNLNKEDLETFLQGITVNAYGQTIWFSKDNVDCTLKELKDRSNEKTESKKGHKIPMKVFSEKFQEWMNKDGFEDSIPEPFRKPPVTEPKRLCYSNIAELETLETRILNALTTSTIQPDDKVHEDTFGQSPWISPKTKAHLAGMTPRKRDSYFEGAKYGYRKKLAMQDKESSANIGIDASTQVAAGYFSDANEELKPNQKGEIKGNGSTDKAVTSEIPDLEQLSEKEEEESVLTALTLKLTAPPKQDVEKDTLFPSGVFGVLAKYSSSDEKKQVNRDSSNVKDSNDRATGEIETDETIEGEPEEKMDVDAEAGATDSGEAETENCICKKDIGGRMVECSGEKCPGNSWFHYGCVGIKRKPKRVWYCKDCR